MGPDLVLVPVQVHVHCKMYNVHVPKLVLLPVLVNLIGAVIRNYTLTGSNTSTTTYFKY